MTRYGESDRLEEGKHLFIKEVYFLRYRNYGKITNIETPLKNEILKTEEGGNNPLGF